MFIVDIDEKVLPKELQRRNSSNQQSLSSAAERYSMLSVSLL